SNNQTVTGVKTFNNTVNIQGSNQIIFGGDTNLYRDAANVLKTDDSFIVGGDLTANGLLRGRGLGVVYNNNSLKNGQEPQDLRVAWSTVSATSDGSFGSYIISWNNRAGSTSYFLQVSKQYNQSFTVTMHKLGGNQ